MSSAAPRWTAEQFEAHVTRAKRDRADASVKRWQALGRLPKGKMNGRKRPMHSGSTR